jgi:hypothetical protein
VSSNLCLMLVFLAAWNAVLRPAADVPITPYYLAFPLLLAVLAVQSARLRLWLIGFAAFAAYGMTVGLAYGVPLAQQVAQLLKYLQLLTFLAMLHWWQQQGPAAAARQAWAVWVLLATVIALAAVQAWTGFEFPTVVNDESSLWLNTFFYTPNDLALFLGGVFCLTLASRIHWPVKALLLALIVALNLRNDAKAVLLALALVLLAHALLVVCRGMRVRPMIGVAAALVMAPLLVVTAADFVLEVSDDDVDLLQLLAEPLTRIADLDPYELGGSVFDRADALIYALQAFLSTGGLGLGPAGSVHTLAQPEFELLTAKSLHNALAEFIVEFGPAALVVIGVVCWPALRSLFSRALSPTQHGRVLLLVAAPLLSVSQSSGFISNYAFWLVAFVVWHGVGAQRREFGAMRSPWTPRPSTEAT